MKPFNNSLATNKLRQEMNVTGGGEAYNASLHATKKKRNPFAEDEMSGYKEMKGFRAGHTKDTGGFQYKDLWDVNEEAGNEKYSLNQKVKVTVKGDINYNKIGEVVEVYEEDNSYLVQFKNGKQIKYPENSLTKPASETSFEDKPMLSIDEEEVGAEYTIRTNDGKIHTGTYDSYSSGQDAMLFRIDGKLVAIKDKDIKNIKKLNENYSRFKKETVTRSKEQQMHEAMKLVRKKLYEADKVMTYVKTMKEELGLQEYKSHTSRLMEKLQVSIAEIYKKYKEIK